MDRWMKHKTGAGQFEANLPHWLVEYRWGQSHLEKGCHFDDCLPVHVNSIEHDVQFKDTSFESLRGQTVRLDIMVQDTDLYGFRFK